MSTVRRPRVQREQETAPEEKSDIRSFLPEENQQITDAFLAEHSEFSRESFVLPDGREIADGQITFWPQRDDVDGFYICRMRRA